MTRSSNSIATGALFALIPPLIWGGMFPIASSLLPTVNAFHMTLVRYATAAALLVIMLSIFEGRTSFNFGGRGPRVFVLGALGFAGFGIMAFTALNYTSATNVSLIMAMMPAISMVVNALALRRTPPGYTIGTILVAFGGVSLVITRGSYTALLAGDVGLGELIALAGAICWVLYTRGGPTQFPTWSPLRYTALTTSLGCITILAATLVASATHFVATPSMGNLLAGWPQLTYLVVLAGVGAVLSWNKGIGKLGALNGTLFMNLVPVTTFTVAVVQGRRPAAFEIIGALVVILALVANNFAARRAAARLAASPAPAQAAAPTTSGASSDASLVGAAAINKAGPPATHKRKLTGEPSQDPGS